MPDSLTPPRWPLLEAQERWVSGDEFDLPSVPHPKDTDPYRAGWSACMQWLARVPPDGLDAEARELWCEGFDDALDAPLGSLVP